MKRDSGAPVILVVDDDEDWREFAQAVLSPRYAVELAGDGRQCLAAVRAKRPALVLLDVMMPGGMDGFRTLCELRKDPKTRTIPIILLSAVNAALGTSFDRDELERYLGVAPSAFIEKPVPPADLLAEIARVLAA